MAGDDSTETTDLPQTVEFHYLKTNDYQPIHVDGVIGGVTPNGNIHMAVFNEHLPIPQRTMQTVVDNKLGDEVTGERVSRGGIVRDVTVALVMNLSSAKLVRDWLAKRVEQLEAIVAKQ